MAGHAGLGYRVIRLDIDRDTFHVAPRAILQPQTRCGLRAHGAMSRVLPADSRTARRHRPGSGWSTAFARGVCPEASGRGTHRRPRGWRSLRPAGATGGRGKAVRVSGPGQQALIRFVDQLSRLRQLAGSPSLNELVALSAGYEWPLRRSTISDKLNARSLPEWDFVVSFVSACREHAEKAGITLPADAADLAGWDTVHWRLLQAVDDVHRDRRLAATAQVEISRRASRVPVPPPATPTEPHRPVPRQLPAAIRHFAGRAGELSALTGLLDEGTRVGGTVVISAIAGTAGVGKTALAVYWALRVADRFPDGQLYVDLRGFDPSGSPVSSAEAVRGFLEALGVPAQQIPASLQAQTGLYRSILAERRVLLVLDNARDVEQIRPVLPGSPDCLVVVTSRNQLTGLAAEGARPIVLDLLSTTEARTLLDRHLGTARTSDHPEAVAEIITLCARLPLALSIVAARAAAYPRFSLADPAGELRRSGGLDAFDGGDSATNVRAVFSWSYRQLDPAAARMFRLLGLHPGPDLSTAAAASLAAAAELRSGPGWSPSNRNILAAAGSSCR